MFSLLFSRDPEAWESKTCRMKMARFGEYGERLPLDDDATLRLLEQLPTLLAYESTTKGKTSYLVRHGLNANLRLEEADLVFEFIVDPENGYFPRSVLRDYAKELGIERNEPYRTHWAVKPGDLPEALLSKATPSPPLRNVPKVYAAYRKAVRCGKQKQSEALCEELGAFPPSEDKGFEYLKMAHVSSICVQALPLLDIEPKTREARKIVDRVIKGDEIIFDPYPDTGQGCSPFFMAHLLDCYGGPTERVRLEEAIEQCIAITSELESRYRNKQTGLRSIAYVLWRSGQCPILAKHLRRRLAGLIDRMMVDRTSRATWVNSKGKSDLLSTAMIVVGVQRLGDDKHRTAICESVRSLCQKQYITGGLPEIIGNKFGHTLTTAIFLVAIQRSAYADELVHVQELGEKWLMHQQTPTGAWRAKDWPDESITAAVLDYFQNRSKMLPQVDGYFLMARDFFKKAIDLKEEGGVNNRRLATIAAVHSLEMFLYGLFEQVPELGVSTYKEKGDMTLGPRISLSEFQASLRRFDKIGQKHPIKYRDQISLLIRCRDNIIHHASQVSCEELDCGLQSAHDFVKHYGKTIGELDIFQ